MKNDLFNLKNYCSIITGAAQGLGKYMALALASYGSNIVIADTNLGLAKKVVEEFKKKEVDAIAIKMDVRNENQINKMIKSAINTFGKIDVLINNAGIAKHINVEDMSFEDWQEVMDVNLNGVFKVSKAVGREMI